MPWIAMCEQKRRLCVTCGVRCVEVGGKKTDAGGGEASCLCLNCRFGHWT